MKCGGIEGNDGAGCVRDNHENVSDGGQADGAIVNENQSDVNGADSGSDNDSCDDISAMPVNEVFVGCLEFDEYFTTVKLDELKKWELL